MLKLTITHLGINILIVIYDRDYTWSLSTVIWSLKNEHPFPNCQNHLLINAIHYLLLFILLSKHCVSIDIPIVQKKSKILNIHFAQMSLEFWFIFHVGNCVPTYDNRQIFKTARNYCKTTLNKAVLAFNNSHYSCC